MSGDWEEVREQAMRMSEGRVLQTERTWVGSVLVGSQTERPCGWTCKSKGQSGQGGRGQTTKDLLGPVRWFLISVK